MKNKIIQFIKKHELDCFAPLLFVLLIVGVPGFLLVHHNQKLRKEANQNPSEYLVSIYIKNGNKNRYQTLSLKQFQN